MVWHGTAQPGEKSQMVVGWVIKVTDLLPCLSSWASCTDEQFAPHK